MIRKFDRARDYEKLQEWWNGYGQAPVPLDMLPEVGFINDQAACFVVKTDIAVCFLEHLIAAPGSYSGRSASLDQVVNMCLSYADAVGFKLCYALTEASSVMDRAIFGHKFKFKQNFKLLERELI